MGVIRIVRLRGRGVAEQGRGCRVRDGGGQGSVNVGAIERGGGGGSKGWGGGGDPDSINVGAIEKGGRGWAEQGRQWEGQKWWCHGSVNVGAIKS